MCWLVFQNLENGAVAFLEVIRNLGQILKCFDLFGVFFSVARLKVQEGKDALLADG